MILLLIDPLSSADGAPDSTGVHQGGPAVVRLLRRRCRGGRRGEKAEWPDQRGRDGEAKRRDAAAGERERGCRADYRAAEDRLATGAGDIDLKEGSEAGLN